MFVAGFIGTPPMNLLPADWLRAHAGSLPDSLPTTADLIGIRPDDLTLAAPEGPHLTMPATLELLEPAGAESHLYLRLEGMEAPVTLRAQGRPRLDEGAEVAVHASTDRLHPFENATGRRAD